jgi:hypothetical protein
VIVEPSEIHFLSFTVQAYEGIATVTTLDSGLGLVRISIAPGCEADVAGVLAAEKERLRLRDVEREAGAPFRSEDAPEGPIRRG